jgi:protein-S-isoprenylcysteine O-methyltransferase Ste14
MGNLLALIVFLLLSLAAVVASLPAWRARMVYGLYRFIAFETLASLIARNVGHWFHEPLSIPQLCSWTLFVLCTVLAVHGIYLLRKVGHAGARMMEDTDVVVGSGVYRYVRHPLYAALALFGWGVFLKRIDPFGGVLAVVETAFLVATARCEEAYNLARFGSVYAAYRERTKMFIPFVV